MKSCRRFCRISLLVIAALVLYNGVVWSLFTRSLLTREGGWFTGDLARMGYLSGYTQPRQNTTDLPRQRIDMSSFQGGTVDVVTVGDSFSQGGASGPNRYYQDYLATLHHLEVLNVPRYPEASNFMEQVVILLNSGFLDQVRPRYLILEIAERNCYRYGGTIDFSRSDPLATVLAVYRRESPVGPEPDEDGPAALPQVGFFNSGNLKWLLYNALYPFSDNAFFAKISKVPLKADLFSGQRGNSLLYLNKDVRNLGRYDAATLEKVNENLNRLSGLLAQRGIKLYFMPAVDKSNLYRPYVRGDHYPESHFFEIFRTFDKEYHFIDTKVILQQELEKGEQDIFWLDDTHWSWKASRAISKAIVFQ